MSSKIATKIPYYLSIILLSFLPFSSWLISLTGNLCLSLARDLLVLILLLFAIFLVKNKPEKHLYAVILLYCGWVLLSIFWREADLWQWLRGVRFAIIPFILIFAVASLGFNEKEKRGFYITIFVSSMIVLALGLLEFIGVRIPLADNVATQGTLQSEHLVGNSDILRLQSILAGPNALGLYLLSVLGFWWFLLRGNWRILVLLPISILFLTYSRSAWIGLVVLLMVIIFPFIVNTGWKKKLTLGVVFALLLSIAGFFYFKPDLADDLILHGNSSSLRAAQIERVSEARFEIGFLGRGAGGAGMSSQNRFDGGPNYWTENTYLDVFEEFGLVGLILFLAILVLAIRQSNCSKEKKSSVPALAILSAYLVSGFFINFYTGQAGVWLLFFAIGLMHSKEKDE